MATPPLIIEGDEQSLVDPNLPDAGLPPAVGVQSFQVFRASKSVPEMTDGRGWTYHHHVDMACWKGRLYVGWDTCERDEDTWPSRELYSTSTDGANWAPPQELFPQGVSTPLRMYFFHAANGRMLAIAGLRTDTADTAEDRKGPLVVREIRPDHTLGEVFTLQASASIGKRPPMFDQSGDAAFADACRQLLADNVFLEQQDRGMLLGERRMKWHDASAWPAGAVPGDSDKWVAGKAYSFFRRPDGTLVGISKMGWTTTSADGGKTWTQPVVPPTLVTGKAKVWSQRTRDGRYALVYNPSTKNRFPLVVVTGDDGVHFGGMRVVQGELPIQRYEGKFRSIGPQYTRGISTWADDGSRPDEQAMWLVYSMSKEDIWVSRVPLPVKTEETRAVADDFATFAPGPIVPGWDTYRPKWDRIEIADGALLLERRDPYDGASATRVFPTSKAVTIHFEFDAPPTAVANPLEVELLTRFRSHRAVRVALTKSGNVVLRADTATGRFSASMDSQPWLLDQPLTEPATELHHITFRTVPFRGIGGTHPVADGTDLPREPVSFRIRRLRVETA